MLNQFLSLNSSWAEFSFPSLLLPLPSARPAPSPLFRAARPRLPLVPPLNQPSAPSRLTAAALSVRCQAGDWGHAGAIGRHQELRRVHRSPFDAFPSFPEPHIVPSATSHRRRLGPPSPSLLRASPS